MSGPPLDVLDAVTADPGEGAPGLRGADLSGRDLRDVDLRGKDLSGAFLDDAILLGADLEGCVLREAKLRGAELTGARLRGAVLDQAQFGGATLAGADLREASAFGASFTAASLTAADLRGADLRAADLNEAILRDCDLRGADLSQAHLCRADISGSRVDGADFFHADLQRVSLEDITGFERARWIGVDLNGVNFVGAYRVRRFVLDQNYLEEFRAGGRSAEWAYRLWRLTSDCGRSMSRWLAWTAACIGFYAFLFTLVGIDYGDHPTYLSALYFSVVTLTTLGYGDVTPSTVGGQIVCMAAVVTGYLMLGGLLSILSNKMARRAE